MSDREQTPRRSNSLIERYTKPRADTPSRDDSSKGSLATETYSAMLDLVLSNGNHYALPYSTLLRVLYNPSDGIRLVFSTDDVHIEGRNLRDFHRGITQHRVRRVAVEQSASGIEWADAASEPEKSVVTAITVTPKD